MIGFEEGQLTVWFGDFCVMVLKALVIFRNFGVKIMESKWMI